MEWAVVGDTVRVGIPHGTVILTEAQLKEMVKAINDKRGKEQRRDLKMPDGYAWARRAMYEAGGKL